MKENLEELKDWQDGAKRELERDLEHLMETVQQKQNFLKAMECTGELIAENSDLRDENESLRDEVESLRQQLQEERDTRQAAEVRLSELNKLSAGVAKKSSQDNLVKALRIFLNISKRKTQSKREAAKMVITEMITSAHVDLPEDILELLDHLDDEQTEPKVVNVTGNYNDIHDNTRVVGLNE